MESEVHNTILITVFAAAFVLGAVANKTNFCTMGAVSDWVNMDDKGRLRAWFLAIAISIAGLLVMEATEVVMMPTDPSEVFPPYRAGGFAWLRYILGGFIFGIGMTLGSGCGNKTLIRIGGGNLKSIFVLIVLGLTAYVMLHTDFFGLYIQPMLTATTINLGEHEIADQQIGSILAGIFGAESADTFNLVLGGLIAVGLFAWVFMSAEFRGSLDNLLAGVVVGAVILVGWYVTASQMGVTWREEALFAETPPTRVAAQSFTFIAPAGDTIRFLKEPSMTFVNFGVMAVAGVILGSLLYSLIARNFRIEWFANAKDVVSHIVGGALMGFGGVLAMGCTIGQGITGASTLALGSFFALGSIIFGSALTMKIQFGMLMDQSFLQALRSALADMKLLPAAKSS